MRRLLVVAALCCFSLQGQSFDFSKAQGYVGGGFTEPFVGFSERHDRGWGILAGGGARLSDKFSLNIEYSFNKFDYNRQATVPGSTGPVTYRGTSEIHGFSFNPRFSTPQVWKFGTYITGGYGVYQAKFQLARPGANTVVCDSYWSQCPPLGVVPTPWALGQTVTWKGGWNAGFGLEAGGRVKFFADARYVYIFTHNVRTEFIPVTFGIHF